MKTLVTGAAGFIGSEVCLALLERGDDVVGIDNLNDYYDVGLKQARIERVEKEAGTVAAGGGRGSFGFEKVDLAGRGAVEELFARGGFDQVVHLAAQPGVRYSLENPHAYIESNINGFLNVLEGSRHHRIKHLVYASSSSVYGANERLPYSVQDNVDHPVSLYAASKKSNELMAHAYSHLYRLPTTGLRFFTVYGPWGRPDMAPVLFTRAILSGETIKVFNHGNHSRDFTYITDIAEGVLRSLDRPAEPDPDWSGAQPNPATSNAPWRIHNIGSNNPVKLGAFIEALENALGKKAKKEFLPLQAGDVPDTYADIESLITETGYRPGTPLEEGIAKFITWYKAYYL